MYEGKVVFEIDLDTKHYDAQMQKTKNDLDILTKKYDELNKLPKTNATKEWLTELGNEIQKTANKYVDLKNKQDAVLKADYKKSLASVKNIGMMDMTMYGKSYGLQYESLGNSMTKLKGDLPYVADKIKDISANVRNAGNNSIKAGQQAETSGHLFDKGFSRGLKSVKKLAMGIIGIRSAYFLARRAASAYMSEDTELTEKMNKAWFNLGAFLEPFLTFVADAMLKITGYLNEFIKALTGTDYLARANAKALAKQTKEQEKLNSAMDKYQQYDFDVIRTQSATGTGSGVGGTVESGLGTLGDIELNQGLVKGIQNLASALKELYDLITFKDVRDAAKEAEEAAHIATSAAKKTDEVIGNTVNLLTKNPDNKSIDEMTKSLEDFQKVAGTDINDFLRLIDNAQEKKDRITANGLLEDWFFGAGKAEKNQIKEYKQSIQKIIYGLVDLGKQGKLSSKGAETLYDLLKNNKDLLIDVGDETKEYAFTLDDVKQAIGNYAQEYPILTAQMYGFKNETESQKKAIGRLISQYNTGKISLQKFLKEMSLIPNKKEIKFPVDNIINAGKTIKTNILDVLNGIKAGYYTTINVDDKDAEEKISKYNNNLLKLPSTILTTIQATLDTSMADWELQQFKSKLTNIKGFGSTFSKLFSLVGFANGGYVSQPTLAMVGEGSSRGEYMIPDGEDYISRLANEIGKYNGGGGTTNIYLDGRLIQRQISKTSDRISFTRNGR